MHAPNVSEVCLFGLRLYVPVNNFSVMSGRSHCFLGITNTYWEVNVSCSRIQHGDPSKDRTPTVRSGVRRSTTWLPCLPECVRRIESKKIGSSYVASVQYNHIIPFISFFNLEIEKYTQQNKLCPFFFGLVSLDQIKLALQK